MTDDERWTKDGKDFDWTLPPPAPWPMRAPFIRWFRATYHSTRLERHNAMWRSMGAIPSGYDRWVLYAVFKGWC